jgi:hypothetical protein
VHAVGARTGGSNLPLLRERGDGDKDGKAGDGEAVHDVKPF